MSLSKMKLCFIALNKNVNKIQWSVSKWDHQGPKSSKCLDLARKLWSLCLVYQSIYIDYLSHCTTISNKIMSQRTTKPTIRPVWPAKTQISLYISPVWQVFLFVPLWIARRLYNAISENSDQTARMRRLTWVFAGCMPYCRFCRMPVQI